MGWGSGQMEKLSARRRRRRRRRRHLQWVCPQILEFRPNLDLNLTKYEQKCNFFQVGCFKIQKLKFSKNRRPSFTQVLAFQNFPQ